MIRSLIAGRPGWLLFAILCIAFYFRVASIRFGLPAMNDPDELIFELGALRMLRGHTLNPGWFGHPATTTMYILALIDALVFVLALLTGRTRSPQEFGSMVYADPSWIILPGRLAMVLFALGTIWLTWSLANRLFGPRVGLVAASLLALNPVHITWSQIIRSDMMACVFMLLCLRSSVAIARTGRQRDYLFAAVWLGLAIATKWPFALSALSIGTATLFAVRGGVLQPGIAARRLAVSGVTAIVTVLLVSPYILLDYATVLKNLQGEGQAHHLGANGGSVWYNFLWYLGGPFHAGFGALGLALAVFGTVQIFQRRERQALVVLMPVAASFLILFCLQRLVWERWALPLMPLGAIFAAFGLVRLGGLLRLGGLVRLGGLRRSAWSSGTQWISASLLLAALIPLGAQAFADNRARMNDTRQQATAWAWAHIPAGSHILIEHNAFDLVGTRWQLLFPMGNAGCVDVVALIHGRASYAVIEQARSGRSNVDYGTMASARRRDCNADFAILTNYGRYRDERDVFPDEYAAYRALLATGLVTATFAPVPGHVGGPVVTIVDLRRTRKP